VNALGTIQRGFLLSLAAACLASCSATPTEAQKPEYQISFGIVTKPDQRPLVLDQPTHVVPLSSDGTIPRIAADVKRSIDEPFILSYVVYRKQSDTGQYIETERSDTWRIRGHDGRLPEALIRPDFRDGVTLGQ
jgi:hypothetical protein